MNPREANAFLGKAALIDPRMKRVNVEEQADMAEMWAEILHDVAMDDAVRALAEHYREKSLPIMPADVLDRVGRTEEPSAIPDITDQIVEKSKQRMLAAAGVTEADYLEHAHDVPWLRTHFPTAFEQHELLTRYPNEEIPDE